MFIWVLLVQIVYSSEDLMNERVGSKHSMLEHPIVASIITLIVCALLIVIFHNCKKRLLRSNESIPLLISKTLQNNNSEVPKSIKV